MPRTEATATTTADHSWDSNSQSWSGKKSPTTTTKRDSSNGSFNYCDIAQLGLFKMKPFSVPSIFPELHLIFPRQYPWTVCRDLWRSSDPALCHSKASSVLWLYLSCYRGLQAAKNLTCPASWCSCAHSSESAPPRGADCCHAAQYLPWSLLSLIWHQRGTCVNSKWLSTPRVAGLGV